jgi:hypothetical protein
MLRRMPIEAEAVNLDRADSLFFRRARTARAAAG